MDETNLSWLLAIACLLAGIAIGALGYRVLNASAGHTQRLRQRLAERDRELAELKDGMGDNLARIVQLAERLQRDSQALEQEADAASERLGGRSLRRQAMEAVAPDPATSESPPVPRDYADGNRGTLSEDFGLKDEDDAQLPQPPRY